MIIRELTDTGKFKIGTAEFTLRVLDAKTYKRLASNLTSATKLLTGGRAGLRAEDLKEALAFPAEKLLEAEEALQKAYVDFIRHGVAGHKGITRRGGEELFFAQAADGTVHEDTLAVYDLQRWNVRLGQAVMEFNGITEEEEKN